VSVEIIDSASFNFEFRLHCRTRSFILYALGGEEDRNFWFSDIQHSIKGTHPEELKKGGKTDEESKEREDHKKNDSPSSTTVPVKKKSKDPSRTRAVTEVPTGKTQPATGALTDRPASKKKAENSIDHTRSSPGIVSGDIVVAATPLDGNAANNIFLYTSPLISNNPFLDVPSVDQNPFATTTFTSAKSPYAAASPSPFTPDFANPRMTLDPNLLRNMQGGIGGAAPSPFATTPNPFAQPSFGQPSTFAQPNKFAQPGQFGTPPPVSNNPFATSGAPNPFATTPSPFTGSFALTAANPAPNPFATTPALTSPNPFATTPAAGGNHFF